MNNSVFMSFNLNDTIRKNSSSGGVFSAFSEYVISNNGVIYGAAYDDEFIVRHVRIDKIDDIARLRGSKYVQSKLDGVFEKVELDIRSGLMVLFSGTPCQISALRSYLQIKKIEENNIFLIDVVCHGVPSVYSWNSYLKAVNSKNKKIKSINLCDKNNGWNDRSVVINYADGTSYTSSQKDDYYIKAFTKNANLRPSCYDCKFKGLSSGSDITIGDFWGYDNFSNVDRPEEGCSLVIVNTEKGQGLKAQVKSNIKCRESKYSVARKGNPYLEESVKLPSYRKLFYKILNKTKNFHFTVVIIKLIEIVERILH